MGTSFKNFERKDRNMDKFLELVYQSQIADEEDGGMWYKFFLDFIMELEDSVSEEKFEELRELLIDATTECNRFYAVKGMELAIGILNGTYVAKI